MLFCRLGNLSVQFVEFFFIKLILAECEGSFFYRLDLRTGFKFNSSKKKQSHLIYLELQNVTDNDNIFINRYNRVTKQVNRIDQIGFYPDFGYKFQF